MLEISYFNAMSNKSRENFLSVYLSCNSMIINTNLFLPECLVIFRFGPWNNCSTIVVPALSSLSRGALANLLTI